MQKKWTFSMIIFFLRMLSHMKKNYLSKNDLKQMYKQNKILKEKREPDSEMLSFCVRKTTGPRVEKLYASTRNFIGTRNFDENHGNGNQNQKF